MKNGMFRKLLPHLIAIAVFLIVAVLFCSPALQGKVLQQHDIIGAQGMAQNSIEHYEKYGNYPLWNTNLFSGMPNFQVLIQGPTIFPDFTTILTLGLPKPIHFFFLACICFYILCLTFRLNPYISMLASLAFAYTSYDPIIIATGHDTKMLAMAYAPALLGGLKLLYEKRYWLGLALTAFFASMEITVNHPQINFYFLIAATAMTISYLVIWIKSGEWKHAAVALSLALLGGLIGVGSAATTLLTTYDYTKYTMRGGKTLDVTEQGVVEKKTTGLDLGYAFQWSLGKSETATLLMPNAFGGSSAESFEEDSKLVEELVDNNIPESAAIQLAGSLPKYWGGIVEGTAGPVYIGVITCLLFVIGLVAVKNHHKWWILVTLLIGIMLAWGKYLPGFNTFLFENLPIYNKFRAPSMALVITQFVIPLLAALGLQAVLFGERTKEENQKLFKQILYGVVGLVLLLGLIYVFNEYDGPVDDQIRAAYSSQQGGEEMARLIINSLESARKAMYASGIMRVILFALLLLGTLYLWNKRVFGALAVILILMAVNTIDLLAIGKKYLNEDNYVDQDAYTQSNFAVTPTDQAILEDGKDEVAHFRVYNLAPDRFQESRTSYFHRSLGGYHPAKLRIYQDLIENQLSKDSLNMAVLNMLDTRYFIIPDQQTRMPASAQRNDNALGAAWFVQQVQPVNGPVEEINALNSFDPKQTAFIDRSTQNLSLKQSVADPSATITLTKYNNDTVEYATKSATDQFAVFSEIYYPSGWNAYIDGKKTEYFKVNYVLRGMPVPAGNHTISFRFEPDSYATGYSIAFWSYILLYLILLGALFMTLYRKGVINFGKKQAV